MSPPDLPLTKIDSFPRIIVFRPGQFGDTLAAFPALEALSALAGSKPLIYVTNRFRTRSLVQAQEVLKLSPCIRQCVTYAVEDSASQRYRELCDGLSPAYGDLFLYLTYPRATHFQVLRDWFFFHSLGFRNLYGFRAAFNWRTRYLRSQALPRESERLLDTLVKLGMSPPCACPCKLLLDHAFADDAWNRHGLNGQRVLAVAPGSKMQAKRWPLARYMEVCSRWSRESGCKIIIVGGSDDAPAAQTLAFSLPGTAYDFCGVSLAQSGALLAKCTAFLGNDSGAMHLAALLGLRTIAIFSARERVGLWFPAGEGHTVFRHSPECQHCARETCFAAEPPCLASTTVEMVLQALRRTGDLPPCYAAPTIGH